MSVELAKEEFRVFLARMGRKFEIMGVRWTEDRYFEAKFRAQIPSDNKDYNSLCEEWVEQFSSATGTVWVKKISNTGPKVCFRTQYQCWTHVGLEVKKEMLFDPRRCRGTLDIKVLTNKPSITRKNKYIKMGLNAVVKINFFHLHRVDTTKSLAFFVHPCDPQPELPKPVVQPDPKISQKVAEILQKSASKLESLKNTCNTNSEEHQTELPQDHLQPLLQHHEIHHDSQILLNDIQTGFVEIPPRSEKCDDILQNSQFHLLEIIPEDVHIARVANPLDIKLDSEAHLQQLPQAMIPQLDMSDHVLMCPPSFMFDPSQLIPVSTHLQQFVPVHSHNLNNEHYL